MGGSAPKDWTLTHQYSFRKFLFFYILVVVEIRAARKKSVEKGIQIERRWRLGRTEDLPKLYDKVEYDMECDA